MPHSSRTGGEAPLCKHSAAATCLVDFPVPGRPFTFGQLISAQAADDAAALAALGRPILRLHLTSPAALAYVTHLLRSRRVPE